MHASHAIERHGRPATMLALAAIVAIATVATPLRDARAEVTPDQVNRAINDGVAYLRRQQLPNGSWPEYLHFDSGVTALCTLALLNAGVEPDDPTIQRALGQLRGYPPRFVYTAALRTMVFATASPERDKALITRHVRWLEQVQFKTGSTTGGWNYGTSGGPADNSNTQFAILALYEAERVGVQADIRTWTRAREYWIKGQNRDGSWSYTHPFGEQEYAGTGSMTCAGIASMTIIDGAISRGNARVDGDKILCCQDPNRVDDAVERGTMWMTRNIRVSSNPGMQGQIYHLYYLYGLERVGRLTAKRFFGEFDWYREGAEYLIRMKGDVNDHWQGASLAERDGLIATSFVLLFLTKGRRPVLLSKLQYGSDHDWNAHPNDVNNLTRFVESQWDMDLTWQVVPLASASPDELVQSPVLYLCGGRSPLPTGQGAREELAARLRAYLDRGGFLLIDGYCGDESFDEGVRALMELVLPEKQYRLQPLPPSHPVWSAEIPVAPDQVRPLEGIDFGCRTSVIYSPPGPRGVLRPSLSCLWEVSRPPRGVSYLEKAQDRIDAGLAIGINVLAYATNRELKFKYEIPAHLADTTLNLKFERGNIYIANVQHPGGCNVAPNALLNLMKAAADEAGLPMGLEQRNVDPRDSNLFNYHLVYMHGRNAFRFTAAEHEGLRTYIERGGMIFANSICASESFTESFERELKEILPNAELVDIPANDPMLTREFGGFDLSNVTLRVPQRSSAAARMETLTRKGPPKLKGVRIDGRWVVVFSPLDISCALEKQNSLECEGYTREDAARIGLNVLLYSLEN